MSKKRTERTGIYAREVVQNPTSEQIESFAAEDEEHRRTFLERLEAAIRRLPRAPYGQDVASARAGFEAEMLAKYGKHWQHAHEDAAEARALHGDLGAAILAGDLEDAVSLAVELGMILERLKVRPFEPDAARGKKLVADAARGGELKKGKTKADPAPVVAEWQDLRAREPGLNLAVYDSRIAQRFGVSPATVSRYRRKK